MNQLIARRRLHYGWIVVAEAGAVLIGAGVRSAPGIFLIAMEEDIGISHSSVAGALAVAAGVASQSIKRNQRPVLVAAT